MESILQTRELTKRYRANTVVDRVHMTIEKGDIYGFVGENGAGKTTIIRMISGLVTPTSGGFSLFGTDSASPEIHRMRRLISAVVESPSLYTNMTAMENLGEQCRILGISEKGNAGLLETVGLGEVAGTRRKAGNFSLGMRQRLGLAMALVGEPELILLDEPMNGLDPQGIIDIRELILRLNHEKNITFLISSHILGELSLVATKYGFISKGRLLEEISAAALHEKCRSCVEIECTDTAAALRVISEAGLSDCRAAGNTLRVFDDTDIGELITKLHNSGVKIEKVFCRDESIEDYYLKLTGGTHDERPA